MIEKKGNQLARVVDVGKRPVPEPTTVRNVPAVPGSVKGNGGSTKRKKLGKKRRVVSQQYTGIPQRIGRPLNTKPLPPGFQDTGIARVSVAQDVPTLPPVGLDSPLKALPVEGESGTGLGAES